MTKDLERAKFDYVLFEDKLMVSTAYGGTMEYDLKHGVNPSTTRSAGAASIGHSWFPGGG